MRARVWGLFLWLAVTSMPAAAAGPTASGRPNPYLGQAKNFYQGLNYEKCLSRLRRAVRWENNPHDAAEVALYQSLCHFHLGHEEQAGEYLVTALRLDPAVTLPPETTPRYRELFRSEQARLAPPPPEPPAVVAQPPEPSPVVASVPPAEPSGLPTDAPRRTDLNPSAPVEPPAATLLAPVPRARSWVAPGILAGVSAAAGATALYFGLSAQRNASAANAATFVSDADRFATTARRDALISNIGIGVASAALVSAVLAYVLQPTTQPAPTPAPEVP